MAYIKKELKIMLFVGIGIFLLYLLTRLFNLTALPIFTDEAIYIRWSQIGAQDASWRFISLTDGKQPFFTWVVMLLMRIVQGDPLFVGRLASVVSGIVSLIGIWVVAYELFGNKRVAFLSALMYVISPFMLWYDRMALYDSWVNAFFLWSLYLSLRLARNPRLDTALLLGMSLGCGMLNKSSGFLSLYLLPFTLILFDWKKTDRAKRLMTWVYFSALAAVLSQILYSILRLSPFFYIVGQKDHVFLFTASEWLNQPFRFFEGNLRGMFDWVSHYMTIPIIIASFLSLFFIDKKIRERIVLLLYWLLPFVALANFAKVLYPRFVMFMTIPLYLLAADFIIRYYAKIKRPLLMSVLALIVFVPSIVVSYKIITDPLHAPIPKSDRLQYIDDWPSGWGVPEVVSYLRVQSQFQAISVFTEGTFGLFPYALEIYLVDNKNISIQGIWPLPEMFPEDIYLASLRMPTFVVLNETQVAPATWPLQLIGQYKKGTVDKYMRLFKVIPPLAKR